MTAEEQYAIWLALVRGELSETQAAAQWGLDVPTVRRIREVAEQGALAALSALDPDATAQVGVTSEPEPGAGERVRDLLAASPEFVGVSEERLQRLAKASVLVSLGERTPVIDRLTTGPFIVLQGTLSALDARGRPVDLVGRGAYRPPDVGRRLVPVRPTSLVALPAEAIELAGADARARLAVGAPLGGSLDARPRPPVTAMGSLTLGDVLATTARRVVADDPVAAGSQREVSSAAPAGLPNGDPSNPILSSQATPIDALARMLETGASIVTVVDAAVDPDAGAGVAPVGGRLIGEITARELPLPSDPDVPALLAALADAGTVDELVPVGTASHELARALLVAGTDVADVGRLLTAVADQRMRRLLAIARSELGPPPGDVAWLVFGSQARGELTPHSDQDHGLVHAPAADPGERDHYARLGRWMTTALESCGLPTCPGGVMASRPDWRHDLAGWERTIHRWTNPTETSQLVRVDIGLDVRAVYGTGELGAADVGRRLADTVAEASRGELTVARLARAAVARRPPSALWGRVGRDPLGLPLASRRNRFELKRNGVQPIVDLARLHTLLRGGEALNTTERLAAAGDAGALSTELAATLVEGLRLLTWTRTSAQLATDRAAASDHVDWAALPPPLRRQFSDTFGAIRAAQGALRSRYRPTTGA